MQGYEYAEPVRRLLRPTRKPYYSRIISRANIDEEAMPGNKKSMITPVYEPGEVLALLTPLQEMPTGMYLLHEIMDDWVVLRRLIDDEQTEQLILTEHLSRLPARLLLLFMPVGLQIRPDKPNNHLPH